MHPITTVRLKIQFLYIVQRKFPGVLSLYRRLKRGIWARTVGGAFKILRWLSPPRAEWGMSPGGFSMLECCRNDRVHGRVIIEGQGVPRFKDNSAIQKSGLNQDKEQPWPIFWTNCRKARLAGRSLALLNERKEICVEAVYGTRRFKSDAAFNRFHRYPRLFLQGNWTSVVSQWVPSDKPTNFAH